MFLISSEIKIVGVLRLVGMGDSEENIFSGIESNTGSWASKGRGLFLFEDNIIFDVEVKRGSFETVLHSIEQ